MVKEILKKIDVEYHNNPHPKYIEIMDKSKEIIYKDTINTTTKIIQNYIPPGLRDLLRIHDTYETEIKYNLNTYQLHCFAMRLGFNDLSHNYNIYTFREIKDIVAYSKIGNTEEFMGYEDEIINFHSKYEKKFDEAIHIYYEKSLHERIVKLANKLNIKKIKMLCILLMLGLKIMYENNIDKIERDLIYKKLVDDVDDFNKKTDFKFISLFAESISIDKNDINIKIVRLIKDWSKVKLKVSLVDENGEVIK